MIKFGHLLGRPFWWGINDCRTLAADFYKDNFDIEFPTFDLPTDWDNGKAGVVVKELLDRGFEVVDYNPYKTYAADLYVSAFFSPFPNHISVCVGGNFIIHHVEGRLSEVVEFKGVVRSNLCATLRHPKVMLEEDKPTLVDVLDDAPYQIRRKFE